MTNGHGCALTALGCTVEIEAPLAIFMWKRGRLRMMISVALARRLRDAGLEWVPQEGDRFMIPDRGLEDEVFSISDMTIDVNDAPGGRQISFNGAVEWALDSIMKREVVWLPSEAQLRDRLGLGFESLERHDDRYVCRVKTDAGQRTYDASDPADAYGLALLDLLAEPEVMLRLMVGGNGH
jgi:hypothetical protein